jgi:hypothetical protein
VVEPVPADQWGVGGQPLGKPAQTVSWGGSPARPSGLAVPLFPGRGQGATLERLRVDRHLQEALACGPDPLHLAAMFGLDPKTAIRYAENARRLLVTAAEQQDPA